MTDNTRGGRVFLDKPADDTGGGTFRIDNVWDSPNSRSVFRIFNSEDITQVISFVDDSGNVGIGTSDPTEAVHVVGNIRYTGNLVNPDYVFEKYFDGYSNLKNSYEMPSLEEVAAFTKVHKH